MSKGGKSEEDDKASDSSQSSRSSQSSGSDSSSDSSGSGSDEGSDAEANVHSSKHGRKSKDDSEDDVENDDENANSGYRSGGSSRGSKSVSGSDSSHSRSRSGSGSRSSSASSRSGSHLSDSDSDRKKKEKDKFWENDPELFGIRRSHRPRVDAKPSKLHQQSGHKRGSKKHDGKSAKRRKISTEDSSDEDDESSRSVRKRGDGGTVSYKEAESEDEGDYMTENEESDLAGGGENGEPEEHVETIERVMDSRMGKRGATGSTTTIYAVAEKGDPNTMLPPETEDEKQFLIKWAGWSHLHNTWESLQTLQEMKVKGLKKLDNFCKKEDEQSYWKSRACPEDVEYAECQLELQQELVKSYVYAERVIAEKTMEDGHKEYYVKWESLPYFDATWESAELIKKRNPEVIKDFKKREASNRTPSLSSKYSRNRPKFLPVKHQPDYLKGENLELVLRDYQMDGLNWLVRSWCKENSVILADEMGLGKTIQTICFLAHMFESYNLYGPFLLVVPLSTMAAWQKEFSQWAPQINVVTYLGDIPSRTIIQEYEWYFKGTRKLKFNALLTTYEIVLKDQVWLSEISWAALMVDEAHRLKNQDSLLYKALVDFDSNHRLLITGTPLQNSLKELWALLHFIMPHKFDDWELFEKEHDQSAQKGYVKLHKQLEPFILRRVKKDVEKSLPSKVEQILRVEMTTMQKQYYKWILTKNYTALRKGVKGSVNSFINVVMELKKCCNHATLIRPFEAFAGDTLSQLIKGSGKLMLLDKLLVRLKDTGHRVLIFSQMVMMLDIISEYLQLRRFPFQRLDGGIKGDLRKQALDHFNAEGSTDFCFLLSTRAGGLGINLATADTVIIFDSDWNPMNDLQAQARAHRIGQKNQVMIYRLVTKNSVEEDIVERAKRKMVLDHLVIQRMDTTGRTVLDKGSKAGNPFNKDELNAILKFGAEELFKENDNEGDDNCDIDEILRRAETHEEAARPGDELLSAFKVASFTVNEEDDIGDSTSTSVTQDSTQEDRDWDAIIPLDLRKQVEAEEKEKEMADLYLPPRSSRAAIVTDTKGQPLGNEALNRKAKNRKRKRADVDKESEVDESDSDDDETPRKRGRPKHGSKDKLKGFNDTQVRKFLKSLKRFAAPLHRVDKIAKDCGMDDRNPADLKKLAEMLIKGCEAAIAEQKAHPHIMIKEEPQQQSLSVEGEPDGGAKKKPQKPREKGPHFKVCGVQVNARTMSLAIEDLQSLGEVIPLDESSRRNWRIDFKTKNAGFDVEWGPEEDSRLLIGIWEHGMGSWDKIREADQILREKVFLEGDKKPMFKNIAVRADYLLRQLKKHQTLIKLKQPKPKKKRESKVKKEDNTVSSTTDSGVFENGIRKRKKEKGKGKEQKEKGKRTPKKKNAGPMHYTAKAEPTAIAVLGDLDPVIFQQCKDMMRPAKKALKSFDNPDRSLPEKAQIHHTRTCLIEIGKRIDECLRQYPNPNQAKEWKGYLWYFVSQFTEFDAKKLYKVYKRAIKEHKEQHKVEKHKDKEKGGEKKNKNNRKDKEMLDKHKEKKHKKQEIDISLKYNNHFV